METILNMETNANSDLRSLELVQLRRICAVVLELLPIHKNPDADFQDIGCQEVQGV